MAVLTVAAGLADEALIGTRYRPADGLLVGDPRLAGEHLHPMFETQPVDQDLQMQLAHAGQDDLTGGVVHLGAKGRVVDRQLVQRIGELFVVFRGTRRHGDLDHGIGKGDGLEQQRMARIAQGIAGDCMFHAEHRGDVAGAHLAPGVPGGWRTSAPGDRPVPPCRVGCSVPCRQPCSTPE